MSGRVPLAPLRSHSCSRASSAGPRYDVEMAQPPAGQQFQIAHTRFHEHLDDCERCREHPFDLCEAGKQLLCHAGEVAAAWLQQIDPKEGCGSA